MYSSGECVQPPMTATSFCCCCNIVFMGTRHVKARPKASPHAYYIRECC